MTITALNFWPWKIFQKFGASIGKIPAISSKPVIDNPEVLVNPKAIKQ
jgi:hypothetical protein